ncbi:MAG: hypothetical protein LBG45_00600 [Dysgonamonadaceae bacterium]|nr:hypothetical protein [Dysgonamonadaceae bacterium]
MKKGITSLRSESVDAVPFISLLDSLKNRDLAHLTQADWDIINSDEENLVYEPEDYIIYDMYFSSVFK